MAHTEAISTNHPQAAGVNPHDATPLPLLVEILDHVTEELAAVEKRKSEIKSAIERRVADAVTKARAELNKAEGTIHAVVEGCEVTSVIPKSIKWDEKALNIAADAMVKLNLDPFDWIDFSPSVSEKKFDCMPKNVRDLVLPARTLKHGKEKLEVTVIDSN